MLVDGGNQVSLTKSMIMYSCHLYNTCACLCVCVCQTRVELVKLLEPFDLAEAFGRIAFSCPDNEVR